MTAGRKGIVSVLDHVRQNYDFAWSANTFKLFDDKDSVNFGYLVSMEEEESAYQRVVP